MRRTCWELIAIVDIHTTRQDAIGRITVGDNEETHPQESWHLCQELRNTR